MAIHITGDIHGESWRFCEACMPNESNWNKDDNLIICGDFGLIWYNSGNKTEKTNDEEELDWLEKKPYTILFCDGNHENFDELYSYPVVEIFGGKVHKIRDNIYHLMRGEIFNIQGSTYFVMGGAYSSDKYWRRDSETWWPQELPNDEEYENAKRNLEAADYKVDYIITHTCPSVVIETMLKEFDRKSDKKLLDFFDFVANSVDFKHWYFGHWHTNGDITLDVNGKKRAFSVLLHDIKTIDNLENIL